MRNITKIISKDLELFSSSAKHYGHTFINVLKNTAELKLDRKVLDEYKFNLLEDPLHSCLLHNMRLAIQVSMKKKNRILVPDSCVLIGVID